MTNLAPEAPAPTSLPESGQVEQETGAEEGRFARARRLMARVALATIDFLGDVTDPDAMRERFARFTTWKQEARDRLHVEADRQDRLAFQEETDRQIAAGNHVAPVYERIPSKKS